MSLINRFRIPFPGDKVAGFLFLVTLLVPLYIVTPLPDPVELPKLILWIFGVSIALIILFSKSRVTSSVLNKSALVGIGLLFIWSVVSTIFSLDVLNSIFGSTSRLTTSIIFFFVWGAWLFLTSTLSEEKFKWLLKTIVVGGGVIALWGILQSYEIGYYGGLEAGVRAAAPSFLGNPNFTAMYLVPTFFLSIWAVYDVSSSRWKIFYGTLAGLIGWGVILFTSRGAILGLGAGLLMALIGFLITRQKKLFSTFLVLLVVTLSLATIFTKSVRPIDSQQLTTLSDQTTEERLLLWDITTGFILEKPLVGTGPANFFLDYRSNNHSALSYTGWFDDAHNLTLHLAAGMGLPSVIFFYLIVISAFWAGYRSLQSNSENSMLSVVLLAGLVGWLVAASFNPVTTANWLILGLLIVGLFQVRGKTLNISWKPWVGRMVVGIGIALIVIGFLWQASDVLVWRANQSYVNGEYEKALKVINFSLFINPTNISAFESKLKILAARSDFTSLEQTALEYERLHPRSAGVLQKVMASYYIIYRAQGSSEALAKFYDYAEKYRRAFPNSYLTYQNLTYGYLGIGDYEKAVQYAERNAVMNSQKPIYWFILAKAYEKSGDTEGLVFALEKSFLLYPTKAMASLLQAAKDRAVIGEVVAVPVTIPENPW